MGGISAGAAPVRVAPSAFGIYIARGAYSYFDFLPVGDGRYMRELLQSSPIDDMQILVGARLHTGGGPDAMSPRLVTNGRRDWEGGRSIFLAALLSAPGEAFPLRQREVVCSAT